MSEFSTNPPSIPANVLLEYAGRGELDRLNLPDVRRSPFDTTFEVTEGWPVLPEGTHDTRAFNPNRDWNEGDKIRGTFSLTPNRQTGMLEATTETMRRNSPLHAVLQLGELRGFTPDMLRNISMLGLRRIVADMAMVRRESSTRRMFASIGEIYALEQPLRSELPQPRLFEPVLAEGVVTAYSPGRFGPGSGTPRPQIVIQNTHGEEVAVGIGGDNAAQLDWEGLDSLAASGPLTVKRPFVGDRLQVRAHFESNSAIATTGWFHVSEGYAAHLLEAAPEREQEGWRREIEIVETTNRMNQASSPEAVRQVAGALLEARLTPGVNGWQGIDLAETEKRQIVDALGLHNPYSQAGLKQWPLGLYRADVMGQVAHGFGNEVLGMSPEEFKNFTYEVAAGKHFSEDDWALNTVLTIFDQLAPIAGGSTASLTHKMIDHLHKNYSELLAGDAPIPAEHDTFVKRLLQFGLHPDRLPGRQSGIAHGLMRLTEVSYDDSEASVPFRNMYDFILASLTNSLLRCGEWTTPSPHLLTPEALRAAGGARRLVDRNAFQQYANALPGVLARTREAIRQNSWFSQLVMQPRIKRQLGMLDTIQQLFDALNAVPDDEGWLGPQTR